MKTEIIDHAKVEVVLDAGAYGEDAIMKTAHTFTGEYVVEINKVTTDCYRVSFGKKNGVIDADELVADFTNSLLDHEIRSRVAREFADIREEIVKRAFAAIS